MADSGFEYLKSVFFSQADVRETIARSDVKAFQRKMGWTTPVPQFGEAARRLTWPQFLVFLQLSLDQEGVQLSATEATRRKILARARRSQQQLAGATINSISEDVHKRIESSIQTTKLAAEKVRDRLGPYVKFISWLTPTHFATTNELAGQAVAKAMATMVFRLHKSTSHVYYEDSAFGPPLSPSGAFVRLESLLSLLIGVWM